MDSWDLTRSSLLHRLRDLENRKAWEDFYDTYWKLLFAYARRTGLSEADAEDMVMETVICVSKQMEGFVYERGRGGGFKGWLKTIVRRRVADLLRKQARRPQGVRDWESVLALELGPESDLEVLWEKEWSARLELMALEKVRRRVGMKQYQMYYCYVVQEWEVVEVMETLGVSRGQVYSAKSRVGMVYEAALMELEEEGEGEA
ncbi:MAG: sigma-70 family RNA polymerase sigma factor [Verrucomicrobiota bacterium]|nr:sigma-70 family RNA polymerase sigma factor [Verrucomicrobiota bacterium]